MGLDSAYTAAGELGKSVEQLRPLPKHDSSQAVSETWEQATILRVGATGTGVFQPCWSWKREPDAYLSADVQQNAFRSWFG